MEEAVLCHCGNSLVPYHLDDNTNRSLIKKTYCPDCIHIIHPQLNWIDFRSMGAAALSRDGIPFPVDYKTIACYSCELGGFFAIEFTTPIQEACYHISFRLPLHLTVKSMPLCDRCKNVTIQGFVQKDNQWFLKRMCKEFNQDIVRLCKYNCNKFR